MKVLKSRRIRRWLDVRTVPAFLLLASLSLASPSYAQESVFDIRMEELKSANPPTRQFAAASLGSDVSMELSELVRAVAALAVASQDKERPVRVSAKKSLRKLSSDIGAYKSGAVSPVVDLLRSGGNKTKQWAAYILYEEIGPPAVPALIDVTNNPDPTTRAFAIFALGMMKNNREEPSVTRLVDSTLKGLLDSEKEDVPKLQTVFALMRRGQKEPSLIPLLISGANNFPDGRSDCFWFLGEFGPEAAVALDLLIAGLRDSDAEVREAAAGALARIGPSVRRTIPELVAVLNIERRNSRHALREAERLSDSPAPEDLSRPEGDGRGRQLRIWAASVSLQLSICELLNELGANTDSYLPPLIGLLQEEERDVPESPEKAEDFDYVTPIRVAIDEPVTRLFGRIGEPSVRPLLDLFSENQEQMVRVRVLNALGSIGPRAKEAIQLLVDILKAGDPDLRGAAVEALGKTGAGDPEKAVPALIDALNSRVMGVHTQAASALVIVGEALVDAEAVEHASLLTRALESLEKSDDASVEDATGDVRRLEDHLNRLWWSRLIPERVKESKKILLVLGGWLALLLVWIALLFLRPLWLFKVNEMLAGLEYKLPAPLGGNVPLRYAVLSGPFHYHPRVLDAWVKRHAETARENFSRKTTVAERELTLPVQAVLDGRPVRTDDVDALRRVFAAPVACLLIPGEGGSGKTSLACQYSKYSLEQRAERRLASHLMLPLLLEPGAGKRIENKEGLLEFARVQLRLLTGSAELPPEGLVLNLLRRGRVLLVIDGLSEAGEAREAIVAGVSQLPANAVIITSRADERADELLNDLPKVVLRPLKIQGNYLSDFLGAYLVAQGKRQLFEDGEFFDACRRLSQITGGRDITVLLAKMFAEHLLAAKDGREFYELPTNVPDLMLSYINTLNRGAGEGEPEDAAVQKACVAIAWECLKEGYRPQPARLEDVMAALGGEEKSEKSRQTLKYLEARLKIIQIRGVERDQVRFTLDPLAEYLAAIHLIQSLRGDESGWVAVLNNLKDKAGAAGGFLQALYDCCLVRKGGGAPAAVLEELYNLVGPDMLTIQREAAKRQVSRLIQEFNSLDEEFRVSALRALNAVAAKP